ALLLGAPTSLECITDAGKSNITFPNHGVVRLDFPARGEMPAVKVFYHDSARPEFPESFHVPGMENETILPPPDNLAAKGRPTGRQGRAGGPGGGGRGPGGPPSTAAPRPSSEQRIGAGGPGVKVFGPGRGSGPQPGILTG